MLIWLASYPKSGNTLLRAMLASYFFSPTGDFDFKLLINIKQFPSNQFLNNLNINVNDDNEVSKNYIKAQAEFNKKNAIQFVKTHSGFYKFNGHAFTNFDITLGAIYVVRDPRNVVESCSRHFQCSIETSLDYLINGLTLVRNERHPMTAVGTWKQNYESWRSLRKLDRYLLIKYEDLINSKRATFLTILNFIKKISGSSFLIDDKKIDQVCKTTSFENMQKLEKDKGFYESVKNKITKEKIEFFKSGPDIDRKKIVKIENIKKLEKVFKKELKDLGYI